LAKIAVGLQHALAQRASTGAPGRASARVLAQGDGWSVSDVLCTSGPRDRPFEERHSRFSIAIVAAGSFQYRSANSSELMTPGSLLLGNPGQSFECGHEHAAGDRCLSFGFTPGYFERLAADASFRCARLAFPVLRLPPLPALAPIVAQACATTTADSVWEEVAVRLAAQTLRNLNGSPLHSSPAPPSAIARVTRSVRAIERQSAAAPLTLATLAREAGLSPYHFLRTFHRLTGVTPHQYLLRARLREAAMRLAAEPAKILDVALDCGFGDVSNFNRSFRAEFGVTPRAYRRRFSHRLQGA